MIRAAWLLPFLPFVAAVLGAAVAYLPAGSPRRRPAALIAVTGTLAAAVLAVPLVFAAEGYASGDVHAVTIAIAGPLEVTAGTYVNGLAAIVALMVTLVATGVQLYSVEYLRDDPRYPAYAAQVSLFTAAMLAVVVSADLLTLLVGWEVMGLCSYLLIGHYRDLAEAPPAALKAFLVTRVGDVGFLVGILILGWGAGTFQVTGVLTAAVEGRIAESTLTVAGLLILCGVAGKSAQFPLHTWLPDAMAGPTPISALIHAATMVAAGVYVVLRLDALLTAPVLATLGVLAAITMPLGALAALGQDDLKRVLAWSTVSQLAYMLGALAVGGDVAGTFHLLTHAAFKALLFLCAGVVLHEAGTVLMSRLGGARRTMPVTYLATLIGAGALVGVPPLAGWWSKDAVLESAWEVASGHLVVDAPRWVAVVVLASGLLTVALTAAYVTRLIVRVFHGEPRSDAAAHDPPALMRWPILVLAAATVVLGAIAPRGYLPRWLGTREDVLPKVGMTAVALALAAVGAGLVLLAWRRAPAQDPAARLGAGTLAALRNGLYLDALQDRLVVRPTLRLARGTAAADRVLVDGAVEGTGTGSQRLGRLLARLEAGNVQLYLTGLAACAVLIALTVAVTA